MNDTDILSTIVKTLKRASDELRPISPAMCQVAVRLIGELRANHRVQRPMQREYDPAKPFGGTHFIPMQQFWNCEHHPSAIDNYFDTELRRGCNECKQAT